MCRPAGKYRFKLVSKLIFIYIDVLYILINSHFLYCRVCVPLRVCAKIPWVDSNAFVREDTYLMKAEPSALTEMNAVDKPRDNKTDVDLMRSAKIARGPTGMLKIRSWGAANLRRFK